ncbi:MAG: class II aldolase/adducin family protein [Candidatus Lokiarchaeota archaeon]|nr:class II aldolase/adducin family protein [Candidatus Lokiarchaeota archaeon]
METEKIEELRNSVVDAAKSIFSKGLVENNEGNVSIRVGRNEEYLITPTANQYDTITEDQIVHMAFDGTPLSSGKLPSSEAKLHTAIFKSRPKVQCVIHTHSTYATILSIVRKSIPIIMEEQIIYLGGSIDISSYGEAHTDDFGEVALKALGYKNGAILANHGVIVCGKSAANAIKNAELVEKFAKIYWGSLQIGEPHLLIEENLERFHKMFRQLFANCPKKWLK